MRTEARVNVKGNKLALVAQASDLLRKERLALRNFRSESQYNTDCSEAEDMKKCMLFYKTSMDDATQAVKKDPVESPSTVVDSATATSVNELPTSVAAYSVDSSTSFSASNLGSPAPTTDVQAIL